jgi:hypothetical protein
LTQCLHLTPVVLARATHCARWHDCPDVVSELTLLTLDLRDDPADDLRFKSTVLAVAPLDLRRLSVISDLRDEVDPVDELLDLRDEVACLRCEIGVRGALD